MSAAAPLRCPFHPDRDGVGICVQCRRVVCADCATKLDGINHCKGCLEAKIGKATRTPGATRRTVERVAAAAVVSIAMLVLTGGFYAVGLNAADIGWFGSGLSETARALDDTAQGLRDFQRDVGRYPTDQEGLRALIDDAPIPSAPPIAKWHGPYVKLKPAKGGGEEETLRDGYGNRLRYVGPQGRGRPAVLSIGGNRALDTEIPRLRFRDAASGDDAIQWVQ